jgi:hypothetical protein
MLCDLVGRKNNKLVLSQMFYKTLLINELPCIELHGFQAQWARSWPKQWYSLFKWPHIVHMRATLDGKQFTFLVFYSHKKFIFLFSEC